MDLGLINHVRIDHKILAQHRLAGHLGDFMHELKITFEIIWFRQHADGINACFCVFSRDP